MLFPSVVFLAYFAPFFLIAYFLLPWKNLTFFLFSMVFFFWGETKYIGILLAYIAVNYLFGLFAGQPHAPEIRRRWALVLGVTANLGLLCYYKYWTFLLSSVLPDLFSFDVGDFHRPHLPLGISYFTFHGISYLADVYRGAALRSKSLLHVGLYIGMFPHMVAGPIVRYHTIAKALVKRCVTTKRTAFALRLFALGMAQKVLIANSVASLADAVFSRSAAELNASMAWLGTLAYTLQIYFDFCGYSLMAVALGILLGFRLPRNFRYPYFSQSVTEFWRRWHISLSTWFRDYLYIPLGGNRKGMKRTLFNLVTVFFLCGLWHGAAYTFVAWGLWHGLFLVLERLGWKKTLPRLPRLLRHGYVMLVIMLAWVLFRAGNIGQALDFYAVMFGLQTAAEPINIFEITRHEQLAALGVGLFFSVPFLEQGIRAVQRALVRTLGTQRGCLLVLSLRTLWAAALFVLSYCYILAGSYSPFLYFRF